MPIFSEAAFETRESFRTFVPWFSMDELKHVYSSVYNSDPEMVKEGYKYLLVWKARRPVMPPGIEATFSFCEVILQDGKFQDSSDELVLPQLRLMYATTIMRFLNLVLNTTPGKTEKKTLFHLADAVGIPRWIVDIRHDSAHGSILPDIGVLRSAAKFSMEWLKQRYWQEALKMKDLFAVDGELIISDHEQMINKVFDCWENFAIFKLAGLSPKRNKNAELWATVSEIAVSLKSKRHRSTEGITDIDGAMLVLHQKMKEMLRSRKSHFIKPIFFKKMLSLESFLPSEKILALFKAKSTSEDFPEALALTWSEIMEHIWESGSIATLLIQLISIVKDDSETNLRREYALLWLRQILLSLVKMKECEKISAAFLARQDRFEELTGEQVRSAVIAALVDQRPELQGAYCWACLPLPRCLLTTDLVEKFLTSPPPANIHIILPSMMELLDPPLPSDMQECLKDCHSIAIFENRKKSLQKSMSDTLFTLSDVVQLNRDANEEPKITEANGSNSLAADLVATELTSTQSLWKPSSDIFSWSRSAFGILPWQCENVTKVWNKLEITNAWKKENGKSLSDSLAGK